MIFYSHFKLASFEVSINDKVVHSKLSTMAFPDFEDVVQIVDEVNSGNEPRNVSKTISDGACSIM